MPYRRSVPSPQTVFKTTEQLCYCGNLKSALPPEPLDKHNLRCLMWDWAMAVKKITPSQRNAQLDSLNANPHR